MEINQPLVNDPELAIVAHAADALSEHFDTVQIFVQRHDGSRDVTKTFDLGRGNIYARLRQAQDWLTLNDEHTRVHARRLNESDESE